jgi:multiple sugar transport system permease protein
MSSIKSTSRVVGGTVNSVPPTAPRRRRRTWIAWVFLAPVLVYLLVFYLYPLLRNIELSLRDYNVRAFVQGDAAWVGLNNYVAVVTDPTFWPAVWHTATFTVISIAFQFTLGMLLALFFKKHFPLGGVLRALFLIPWLLPLIVSASTWSWMLDSDSGVVNSFLEAFGIGQINWLTSPQWALTSVTIANIWIGIPFNLVILYSGLQAIPEELLEASALDGANAWSTFWRVTFPLLRPVSAITILLGLVYTIKVFDIIWIMTRGGPGDSSTTLSTWAYEFGFGSIPPEFDSGAAVGNILIIIALVLGLIYVRLQRRLEIQ